MFTQFQLIKMHFRSSFSQANMTTAIIPLNNHPNPNNHFKLFIFNHYKCLAVCIELLDKSYFN